MKNLFFFNQRSNAAAQATECAYTTGQKFVVNPTKAPTFIAVLLVLITGINTAWAGKGFWGDNAWDMQYYTSGGSNSWLGSQKMGATYNLGIMTNLYLKGGWVKTWSNDNWTTSKCRLYYWIDGGDAGNNYLLEYSEQQNGDRTWTWDNVINYNVIGAVSSTPGNHTLKLKWKLDESNDYQSSECNVTFTYPGFTTTSKSHTFANTTVSSTKDETISFTRHYGTSLTTSNCALSGTNSSEFEVRSISETGVTVRFKPSSDGSKSATLTITDAHSKTCTITLSGTTQRTVTYSKGNYGTGSNLTDNKIYNTTLTLKNGGHFTRTGYHQTGWNTNSSGSGGTHYALGGSYTSNSAVTLYPEWTINTYTIAFSANDANYPGPAATGTTVSIAATYGVSYTLTTNAYSKEGYTFNGWSQYADGTGTQYTDGQSDVSNLTTENEGTATLYAKWTGHTYTVTYNPRGGSDLDVYSSVVTMGAAYGSGTNLIGEELPTVTPPDGYYFDGWYTAAEGGEKITKTSRVATPSDHTLYAHYTTQTRVYFKNTLGWSKVYVTYDATWNNDRGAGNKDRGIYHEMTLLDEKNKIYVDIIPAAVISSWKYNIAFNSQQLGKISTTDTDYSNYESFDKGEAVFRMDFDSRATMFVPTNNKTIGQEGNFKKNSDKCSYFSTGYSNTESDPRYTSGYWRTYNNTYSGYTLTYQKNGDDSWKAGNKLNTTKAGDSTFVFSIDMVANQQYNFSFYKECKTSNTKGYHYQYGTKITSAACTNIKLTNGGSNAYMQTTVEGRYIFKLTMKSDGHIYLTIDYPFGVNDYKVVYSYTKGSAQTFSSEYIKARANGKDTISIFIHSGDSATSRSLKIHKCTGISSGTASWNTSYATITLPSETANGKTSGVYNFIISQNSSSAASGTYWKPYDGNYYIRTSAADGGWDLYKFRPDNKMTLSEYSLKQTLSAPYSHYYCRYIESTSLDITYTVATDYSPAICATLVGDATIGGVGNKTLPASANVRFSWNEETNATRRAYLKSAQGDGNARYLVLHGADNKIRNNDATGTEIAADGGKSLAANELLFTDQGNWVYQVSLKAKPSAQVSLIANYNSADRYLVGGASSYETILGGTGDNLYEISAIYDFKSNRLLTAWTPSGDIEDALSDIDLMLIRYKQNAGTAITFDGGSLKANRVTGALQFKYSDMVGHVANWNSDSRPLLKYFISFPFDVNVSDVFGLNSDYGDAYVIQKYNGALRAEKGFFRGDGTTTFWEDLTLDSVMHANEGYCVILDNEYFNGDVGSVWENKASGSSVYLYFPSTGNVGSISGTTQTINVPSHECKINREFNNGKKTVSHKNTDSHWNMMGVPVFHDHSDDGVSGQPGAVFADSYGDEDDFNYFYAWSSSDNKFTISSAKDYSFKTMHSYMVQFHGGVTFTGTSPASTVAARKAPQTGNYSIELQVQNSNAEMVNRTYVELRDEACDTFALNEDVYMSYNNKPVEIYTFAGNYDVAANVLSVGNHTIPVGIEVRTAGTYKFTTPSAFDGTMTLIDKQTGERTNLAIGDMEVELPKGTFDDRFLLEVTADYRIVTDFEFTTGEGSLKDGKAHKFVQDGILYILRDGMLYDAQGHSIK